MAEAGTQQGQVGSQGQVQGQPGIGQAQGQPSGQPQQDQGPKWLSYIPEGSEREEAKSGWMKDQDYRQKTEGISKERKDWEAREQEFETNKQYADFYNQTYLPMAQQMQPYWTQIQALIQNQGQISANGQQANSQPQNSQQVDDFFANYDLLGPQQQAQKIAEYNQAALQQALSHRDQQWNQHLGQKEQQWQGFIQRYNAIQTDAVMKALEEYKAGRAFPIQDYINERLRISAGQVDDAELAFNKITGTGRTEELQRQWMQKGAEEEKLRVQNQQQSPGALQQASVPLFKRQPQNRSDVEASVRAKAAEKGWGWI